MKDYDCNCCIHLNVCPNCNADVEECANYLPIGNVVPVVRCKDCRHQRKGWKEDKRWRDGGCWIYSCERNQHPSAFHTVDGYDEDFCSYGERKANG